MTSTEAARQARRWPLGLIAAPAAVSIWSGWVGLGEKCGFGKISPLPGIADHFHLNTAITLPIGVEAYGAYALGAWLSATQDGPARRFARASAIGSLVLGMLGQVAYHLLAAAHDVRAPSPVIVLVACMPVVTLGFGAALTHLLRAGRDDGPALPDRTREMAESAADLAGALAALAAELRVGMTVPAVVPWHAGDQEATGTGTPDVPEVVPALARQLVRELVPAVAREVVPESTSQGTTGVPPDEPAGEPPDVPEDEPAGVPDEMRRRQVDRSHPDAEKARRMYRASLRPGATRLSERQLAEKFPGRGRTWARNRITECRDGLHPVADAR